VDRIGWREGWERVFPRLRVSASIKEDMMRHRRSWRAFSVERGMVGSDLNNTVKSGPGNLESADRGLTETATLDAERAPGTLEDERLETTF